MSHASSGASVRRHERFSSILRRSSGSHEPDSPRDAAGAGEEIRDALVSSFERHRDDAGTGLARQSLAPAVSRDDAPGGANTRARVGETTRIVCLLRMRSWE
jgi:hypothetical protein